MKLRWIILGVMALVLTIFVGIPVYSHYHLKHRVDRYRAELRQRGEKITIAEVIPPAPTNGPNGAMAFLAGAGRLQLEPSLISDVGSMRGVPPGRARVAWQQPVLVHKKTNLWPCLASALASNQVALAEVRSALSNPVMHFSVNYHEGFKAIMKHLAPAKNAVQSLSAATIYDLHEGQLANAHENLMAMMAVTKSFEDERILISQLVRIAVAQITISACWEALQHPGFQEPHLAGWQKAFQEMDTFRYAEGGLTMELAMVDLIYREARKDPNSLYSVFGQKGSKSGLEQFKEQVAVQILWPYWLSYEDEYRALRSWQAGMEALRLAQTNQSWPKAIQHYDAIALQIKAECPSKSLMPDIFEEGDATKASLSKCATAETARRIVVTAIALQRCKLRHGKFPEKLTALVPEFLPTEPRDLMDGQPLRYRLNADGTFLLYSVGEDGQDDGGDGTIADQSTASRNWLKGRDWVWPRPATAAEIEADAAPQRKQ
jgi:hypothetical protein